MKGKCCMKFTSSPLLSALFASFLLFPYSSADAVIRATFENPGNAQPVAGVTTISGWAFDTETGSHISSVTLLIDETLRWDIPCCSERRDVPLTFPAVPAEQTLSSGWGMTFNWGLLSAGVHTLKVEIESTSGQIFSTQTRTVTVVKPGEFEFLDQFDLSAAEPSILGNQLVLKGVEVRDKASKQTKTVDVRFRWLQNSQSLGATGSVTADGSWEPRFVFGDQVSLEDQSNMQESTALAMYYIQEGTGLWINDFTVYVFLEREKFLDVFLYETGRPERERAKWREYFLARGDHFASLEYTRTSDEGRDGVFIYGKFFVSDVKRQLGIMAHEYFHVIQYNGIHEGPGGAPDNVRPNGPEWLLEGSAEYVRARTGAHEGLLEHGESSFVEARAWRMAQAREIAAPLQSLEIQQAFLDFSDIGSFELGFMATDFLVDNFGGLPALVSFYDEIGPGTIWQAAFQSTFDISIDEFYAEFEAYRTEHFPPLP